MKIRRLPEEYLCWAEYFYNAGMEHSMWFYLFASYFYEDE